MPCGRRLAAGLAEVDLDHEVAQAVPWVLEAPDATLAEVGPQQEVVHPGHRVLVVAEVVAAGEVEQVVDRVVEVVRARHCGTVALLTRTRREDGEGLDCLDERRLVEGAGDAAERLDGLGDLLRRERVAHGERDDRLRCAALRAGAAVVGVVLVLFLTGGDGDLGAVDGAVLLVGDDDGAAVVDERGAGHERTTSRVGYRTGRNDLYIKYP